MFNRALLIKVALFRLTMQINRGLIKINKTAFVKNIYYLF